MKIISVIIMLLQINLIFAGDETNVVLDPERPVAGQSFEVLVRSAVCLPPVENLVNIENNDIQVVVHVTQGCGNVDPPPPPSFTTLFEGVQITGLDEGQYTLEYYRLGVTDDFPPLPADYASFFVEEIQFEVRGASEPTSVAATSLPSILALMLLMFGISGIYLRKG